MNTLSHEELHAIRTRLEQMVKESDPCPRCGAPLKEVMLVGMGTTHLTVCFARGCNWEEGDAP